MPYVHRLRVRFNECDPQGIVFNGNYLTYADVASNELWREGLGGYDAFTASGHDIVVAEANVRYLAPARFDEELEITVSIDALGTSSMTWRNHMAGPAGDVAVVTVRYVCIGEDGRSRPIPDELRERLAEHLTHEAAAAS